MAKWFFIISFLFTLPGLSNVEVILQQQKQRLQSEIQINHWQYPMYMGLSYTSQVWLISRWLGMVNPDWDPSHFKKLLLQSQLADGSWQPLKDPNNPTGELNATLFNYWALKSMGLPTKHPALLRARNFILKNGGAEKADKYTKVFLMTMGLQSWKDYPTIPNIPLIDLGAFVGPQLARWIRPSIKPIMYLAQREVVRTHRQIPLLQELFLKTPTQINTAVGRFTHRNSDLDDVRKILADQRINGSWGGNTASTILTQMALLHASESLPEQRDLILKAIKRGQAFNDTMTLGLKEGAYKGVALDGRYWDTALVGQALAELGVPASELTPAAKYLLQHSGPAGGYGFGLDSEMDMDTDDTSEALLFYRKIDFNHPKHHQSLRWLEDLQNDDGGWGAFDKNNVGNWLLATQTKVLADTGDFFDESSADVTGHVLEAFAAFNRTLFNSETVRAGVTYLKNSQESDGSWYGRWGVNYLYGTSAAVIGLRQAGVASNDLTLIKADLWFKKCQNRDGGFGESFMTYKYPNLKCQGRSSVSQTAWALMALMETNPWYHPAIQRAVAYLESNYSSEHGWTDTTINGTGQPISTPMQYPAYAKVFPAMALQRYLNSAKLGYR